MDLSDLTKKRKEHIKSCRDNNDNSHKIIAGLYSDPSHFVYELLQNADDAKASEVIFHLTTDFLKITHNGKDLFIYDDVDSITTVGSSTKDINSIGTFGAGFKSVFAVTKTPCIHSGKYHFQIKNFILPEAIPPLEGIQKLSTVIFLPFNHPDISKEDAYEQISSRLQLLESESLLFLRNIREIQWSTNSDSGHYVAEIKKDKASIITQINNQDTLQEYLVFTNKITIEKAELNIAVAYPLEDGNSKSIVSVANSKLFVFFPTQERTGLKFLVHAPYKTTPSRESIPFNDSQNKIITNKLSGLIADSIQKIKDKGFLNIAFLSLLPLESENTHPLYEAAFRKVKEAFIANALLPTVDQSYVSAGNTLLAREKELTSLLNKSDCTEMFKRSSWVSTEITYDKTKTLRDYLTGILDVPEINLQKFCNGISETFLHEKSDSWVVEFYTSITKNKALYRAGTSSQDRGVLRQRPIIRLENNSHICPENDSGELQVYLPTEGDSKFKTVKKIIAGNEESLEFLSSLGIVKPNNIAEIKEFIIPKYRPIGSDHADYLNDFKRVFTIWLNSDSYRKREVIDLFKEVNFVKCVNPQKSISYQKADAVYFPTDKLLSWFKSNTNKEIFFSQIGIPLTEQYRKFLESLGVRYDIKTYGSNEIKIDQHGWYKRSVNGFNPDFYIQGLDSVLNNMTIEKSMQLWSLLLKYTNKLKGYVESRTNQNHPYVKGEVQISKTMGLLNEHPWLFKQDYKLITLPIDQISLDDLSDDYQKEDNNIERLVKILGLKLDEIIAFEEKTGKKVISQEDFALLQQLKENQGRTTDETEQDSWTPETTPENATLIIDESSHEERPFETLANQVLNESTEGNDDNYKNKSEDNDANLIQNRKDIGNWGEAIAERYLSDKYPHQEVLWLNLKGNVGKGYDFVVRENNEDIAYYEVKSKINESPQLFQITGTQWGWAKQLYENDKGMMYNILLVSNAGKQEPKIKEINNPVALWKIGKLYADPVCVQL